MADVTVQNKLLLNTSNIGAVICRTPITLPHSDIDCTKVYHSCNLLTSQEQLIKEFGDPFIDPPEYTDLLLAYDLLRLGVPVYVSSVYDMKASDDDFSIVSYNGYTEFMFRDNSGNDTIGYKLKSNIKMCQPIIQYSISKNRLRLNVSLYYMNRSFYQDFSHLSKLDKSRLYKNIQIIFDLSKVTDIDIADALLNHGLEIHYVNNDTANNRSFVDELDRHKKLTITFYDEVSNGIVTNKSYWYNLHSNDYIYNLSDFSTVENAYFEAIDVLADKNPAPHLVCMSKLYKSKEDRDSDNNIVRSVMRDLDSDKYAVIQTYLLNKFNEDSDTYLFISIPDVPVSSAIDLITKDDSLYESYTLPEQYNCDIYYGYAGDFIDRSLSYDNPLKVFYSAATLSFYNVLLTGEPYMTNSVNGLNISNGSIKIVISESSADKLVDSRCNSVVLFDTGYPSIHGDRSLSLLPNLRYSHISRNFVRLRRLVKEYLETKKFILNTAFNVQSCINYIRSEILDVFKEDGIISNYSIDYSTEFQTVKINIILIFSQVAESIKLEFVI